GIGMGTNFQLLLNKHPEDLAWTFYANLEGIFQVRNKQNRIFDLRGRPWSRYMLFVQRDAPASQTIPGVNLFTFRTLVRSYGFADFSTGFRFNTDHVEFEFGYNVWGHDNEQLELHPPCQTDI